MKISQNNFILDTEVNTLRALNRGDKANLPLLKTLFTIWQKLRESCFLDK